MIKAKLYFEVRLGYQTKLFKPLASLGTNYYDKSSKKYVWRFQVNNIRQVLALLGKPIQFGQSDVELVDTYSKPRGKKLVKGPSQGTGFVNVQIHPTKPNYFRVTTVREKQPQNTNISFETVKTLWRVIKKQPKDKKVLTHTIAENYCEELGIVDFDVYKDGKFCWKYFFGDREIYLRFYAAIKVLQHYGVVSHIVEASKSGILRKLDVWDVQTEIEVEEQNG